MTSLILRTATLYMQPILLMFSVFLLLRGHNEPGGGFTGGLVGAAAFSLYAFAFGVPESRRKLRADPHMLIGLGLLVAVGSAAMALLTGRPFMTGAWREVHMPGFGALHVGTPMFFDVGVYLVVIGVTLLIIYSMAEEE